jgi:hypothetical protein
LFHAHLNDGVWHVPFRKFDRISAALLERHEHFNVFMMTRFVIVAAAFQTFFQQQQHPCKRKGASSLKSLCHNVNS